MLSMTGYASFTKETEDFSLQIEIKSVNGKYSDLRLNASAFDNNFLEVLRKQAAARTVRGQVTVDIAIGRGVQSMDQYRLNTEQLEKYAEDFEAAFGEIPRDWKHMKPFLRLDHITEKEEFCFDAVHDGAIVTVALDEAFDAFYASRAEEGARLKSDLLAKLAQLEDTRAAITARVPELELAYRERLEARMREFIEKLDEIDEARILSEVGVHAVKATIDEELVRLGAHFEKLKALLDSQELLIGKKLDFYMQEINREYNTIASKVSDIAVTEQIVASKVIVDQIREQAQNIM